MGKENATKRKPSLSANGQGGGVALQGTLEPKSPSPDQRRPGEKAEAGAPAVSPAQDTAGQSRQCPQQEPGPGLSAAGTSLQRKDAWLPRVGPGPSSVRCRCAGLGRVGDAARERHCRPSTTCLGNPLMGLMHFSPPAMGWTAMRSLSNPRDPGSPV